MSEKRNEQIKCFNEEMRNLDPSNPRLYVDQYNKVMTKYKDLLDELMKEDGYIVKHPYWK